MDLKKAVLAGVGGAALTGLAATAAVLKYRRTIPKGAKAVKPFDAKKYLGKWYEVARLDYMFEKNMNYATAEYSLNEDGSIKVKNRGYNYKKQKPEESVGKAVFVGDKDEAKLKVSFFGPFYAGYNVIAVDDKYKYAMVAGRNHNYLWLLSKEKQIPEKIVHNYLEQAKNLGYDTSKLIWTSYK